MNTQILDKARDILAESTDPSFAYLRNEDAMVEMSLFDGEWQQKVHMLNTKKQREEGKEELPYVAWAVECWEPLTISPSIKCGSCGDHGFIRDGKWVRA